MYSLAYCRSILVLGKGDHNGKIYCYGRISEHGTNTRRFYAQPTLDKAARES